VRAFVVVADSFHTKLLRRHLQSVDRYQVLALSRHRALVFQGDRDALDEITVPGVPRTMAEALGEELTDPHLTVASYGGVGGESGAMYHGHGGRKDEIDIDTTRFFRVVDRTVFEHCSRPSGLPLILAALPEHHQPFAEISHNPSLIAHGVRIDPFGIPTDELRQLAWRTFQPRYRQRIAEVLDAFAQARAAQRATDDLAQVGCAAAQGRIATLLVAADRVIAGRLAADGRIDCGDLADPEIDDVLDDLAERVAATGGEIVVLPDAEMPTRAGAAAILRY